MCHSRAAELELHIHTHVIVKVWVSPDQHWKKETCSPHVFWTLWKQILCRTILNRHIDASINLFRKTKCPTLTSWSDFYKMAFHFLSGDVKVDPVWSAQQHPKLSEMTVVAALRVVLKTCGYCLLGEYLDRLNVKTVPLLLFKFLFFFFCSFVHWQTVFFLAR